MTTVTATFADDGWVRWQDGQVQGDPHWIDLLDRPPEPRAQVRPDTGSFDLSTWRSDPWAMVACAQLISDGQVDFGMVRMPSFEPYLPPDRARA